MSRKCSLVAVANELHASAGRDPAHRAARTVVGGSERVMRQTVVSLMTDASLTEHENPGEATVYVLKGRVELSTGKDTWEARSGDLVEIPDQRHALRALEDSSVLLTAVPREFARSGA